MTKQHPSLRAAGHRPWPLPECGWQWRQSWVDLGFLHYRVPAAAVESRLPAGVTVQEYDGSAWLGVVPFRMHDVMWRSFPAMPLFSSFGELNVRTYVEVDGKPGVWFFSLDAQSWPVVFGGCLLYHLPYHNAKVLHQCVAGGFDFSSRRLSDGVTFEGTFRPRGDVFYATAGTFEHWATERYCFYSATRSGAVLRLEVHHAPWPLQRMEAEMDASALLASVGFTLEEDQPRCHFSTGVDVVSYPKEVVLGGS
ncbi:MULTISPECIES: YqjF family protein [unclassified Lentimonas]|uniref:YqjF family protein n=1 Tax=unclassified Lentimonas TaxID=2630993 RepID=UPI001328EB49|nr:MULTISPECIES: DUF2071 domain-containing protein [unclassified Lentimonas]CAA6691456.1 Unannotated [Lentimonas sp. CC10]CAA6693782.1 Unannotated [Lentimonas sp. CC19]CAA7070960.1 Unannotated [Lentimonas sp. CC11]